MLSSIIELLQQPDTSQTIDKTLDLTLSRLSADGSEYQDGLPDPFLNRLFPVVSYSNSRLALRKLTRFVPTIGNIVNPDQDIPVSRGNITLTTELLNSLKIAKKYLFTEKDFDDLKLLEDSLTLGDEATVQAIKDVFMGVPSSLLAGNLSTLMLLAVQVATTGRCTYEDPESGAIADLDYTDGLQSGQLAAAKTGNARWTQPTTADGLKDIVDHLTAIYGILNQYPPHIILPWSQAINLRNQSKTKEAIARSKGIITNGQTVDAAAVATIEPPTLEEISGYISRSLLTSAGTSANIQIHVSDSFYYYRAADGTLQTNKFIPENVYFFGWEGYIERAIVPCATNNFAGGFANTYDYVSKAPRREAVISDGRGLPLALDPRKIASRVVS